MLYEKLHQIIFILPTRGISLRAKLQAPVIHSSHKLDVGKRCRPRSDAGKTRDLITICTICIKQIDIFSLKLNKGNEIRYPLIDKWAHSFVKARRVPVNRAIPFPFLNMKLKLLEIYSEIKQCYPTRMSQTLT